MIDGVLNSPFARDNPATILLVKCQATVEVTGRNDRLARGNAVSCNFKQVTQRPGGVAGLEELYAPLSLPPVSPSHNAKLNMVMVPNTAQCTTGEFQSSSTTSILGGEIDRFGVGSTMTCC